LEFCSSEEVSWYYILCSFPAAKLHAELLPQVPDIRVCKVPDIRDRAALRECPNNRGRNPNILGNGIG
jgi:hypothetical protein